MILFIQSIAVSGQWSVRREEPFQQLYSNFLFGIQQSLFGSMISSLHIPNKGVSAPVYGSLGSILRIFENDPVT